MCYGHVAPPLAAVAGTIGFVLADSAEGAVAIFWATFCAIYIAFHPLRALVR